MDNFNIRKLCKLRIQQLFVQIRMKHSTADSLILILDNKSIHYLSQFMSMKELIGQGIFLVEKIFLKRKKYPKSHAVYFLVPENESIELLIKDFEDDQSQQYFRAHVFFFSKVPQNLKEKLGSSKGIMQAISFCLEINLDFYCTSINNVFSLNIPIQEIYDTVTNIQSKSSREQEEEEENQQKNKINNEIIRIPLSEDQLILQMSEKIYNFLSIFQFFIGNTTIFFENKDQKSQKLASNLENNIQFLFQQHSNEQFNLLTNVSLIILDRSIDPLTPLLHNYHYMPMLYDILEIQNDSFEYEQLSRQKKKQGEENALNKIYKIIHSKDAKIVKGCITDEDSCFAKYWNQHIAAVLEQMPKEFQSFIETNCAAKIHQGAIENCNLEMLDQVAQKIPQYVETLNSYVFQIQMISKIFKIFEEQQLKVIGDIEQSLGTGVDSSGAQTSSQEQFEKVLSILNNNITPQLDKVRLALIADLCLQFTKQDQNQFYEKLKKDELKAIKALKLFGHDQEELIKNNQKERITKNISDKYRKIAKEKQKNTNLELDRYTSKVELIFDYFWQKGKLDNISTEYEFLPEFQEINIKNNYIQQQNQTKQSLRQNIGNQQNKENTHQTIVFFFIGGLSYSEIQAISSKFSKMQKQQKKRLNQQENTNIFIGGTSLIAPNEFVQLLLDYGKIKFL